MPSTSKPKSCELAAIACSKVSSRATKPAPSTTFESCCAAPSPTITLESTLPAADVVIDATGTYGNHNWLGPGGLPALGELAAEPHIEYGLPDVLGAEWGEYANRNILLVGSGHSAATTLVSLAELAAQAPDTWITWVTREELDEKKSTAHSRAIPPIP